MAVGASSVLDALARKAVTKRHQRVKGSMTTSPVVQRRQSWWSGGQGRGKASPSLRRSDCLEEQENPRFDGRLMESLRQKRARQILLEFNSQAETLTDIGL